MNRETIKALLYDKYIRPTEQTRGKAIGIEIEMPVVNLVGGATDFDTARGAAEALFDQYGFARSGIDTEGHCYSATEPVTGDNLSFDCSYNNLELSFGKESDLRILSGRFQDYVTYLNGKLRGQGHTLTGMGINPHNVGMYDQVPGTIEELLEYIATTSIFCTERAGKYIHFHPIPIVAYLEQDQVEGEYFENGSYHPVTIHPEPGDIQYLRTYKFEDLTYRGTIEFRSVCCQPFRDAMTVAAFHMGLMTEVEELAELLERDQVLYHHGFSASELRDLMNRRDWPDFVDRDGLRRLCLRVLELAEQGLKRQGTGAEEFLTPLYVRAEKLESPARYMVEQLEQGRPMEELVLNYGDFS